MIAPWKETTLGEIIELKRGYDLPQQNRRPGPVPLVSSSGISDHHAEAKVKGPGVVTGRYGTIGKVFYILENFWPLNTTLYVRDFKGNDRRFISYFLRSIDFLAYSDKAAVPGVNRNHLHQARVKCPPVEEQQAIASILSSLDAKIELNRRMNETLEALAQTIFKSWFVDSAEAKLPKGWRAAKWGELVTLEYGKSLGDYGSNDGAYPVFGTNGRIGSHSKPLCKHPGIIVGRKGAYRGIHFCSSPFFVIDTAFYVEPKTQLELRWAYYGLLRQDINSMDSGSAIPSTSRGDFYNLPVLLPPLALQQEFVKLMAPCWERQQQNEDESRTLAELRDALLPRLLSGELRIPVAKI